jgi:hypothetical protein
MKVSPLGLRKGALISAIAFATLAPHHAAAQSFNIDLDIFFGSPEIGNGAPSSSFGAAANQPGFWNRVSGNGPTSPAALRDIVGNATGVSLLATGDTGSARGFNNPALIGDFRLLMSDSSIFIGDVRYQFDGLANGVYEVFTYAVSASGEVVLTEVDAVGAISPNPQLVTGPIPANSFANLITHSLHTVLITNGQMIIDVRLRQQTLNASVNGFQIVSVPEPTSSLLILCGLIGLAFARRSKLSTK